MAAQIVKVGPWGGKGGDPWDDNGVYSGIHQIRVCYDEVAISSIRIEYDKNGTPVWSSEHGRNTGNNNEEQIQLDPGESLISIDGFHDTHIRQLGFISNFPRRYGPYGRERYHAFNFQSPETLGEWKIVGFHGRSDAYLRAIGVYLKSQNLNAGECSPNLKTISVGAWGGNGGDLWDDEVNTGIRQIKLNMEQNWIDSIHIEYERNGAFFWSKHGGRGENNIEKIELDYPKERITSISGHYDTYIRSLTFESNEKIYGPYGVEDGTYFSFSMAEGKIVGFHGRSGGYLDCIGVYISNLQAPAISKSLEPISDGGQWGGEGGDMWDDGVYSGIHQIIVVYDKDAIDSIHIEYDNNGSPFWLERGGSTVSKSEKIPSNYSKEFLKIGKIQLDYPREILTSISGQYDTYLRSLTFESNLKKYGPFGSEGGTPFESPKGDCKIVGFYGWSRSILDFQNRSGSYFYRIGVYLSNFRTAVPPNFHTAMPPKDATTPLLESEAVDLVKDVFASAAERDIYTGDGLEIVVVNAEGVKREFLELRRD